MQEYEVWKDESGVTLSTSEGIKEQKQQGLLSDSADHLYTIEADSYEDAMKVHYEKMGWGEYKPMA